MTDVGVKHISSSYQTSPHADYARLIDNINSALQS